MRTKTLLLTAALGAAGVATSMAQGTVFSVNAVGYVNVEIVPGFQMIANPLDAEDNTVPALFAGVPDGFTVYKFNTTTGSYDINSALFGSWTDASQTLEPGEGAFVQNPTQANMTITFVGEVRQGDLSNAIPQGFSIKSSEVPQTGALSTDLNFPAADGDTVYKFNESTQAYDIFSVLFGSWSPSEPTVEVGESVFVNKIAAGAWTRTFSVNN